MNGLVRAFEKAYTYQKPVLRPRVLCLSDGDTGVQIVHLDGGTHRCFSPITSIENSHLEQGGRWGNDAGAAQG